MSSLLPTVVEGSGALPYLTVCNRHARARIYLQGAHVATYRPVGHGEVLWESVRSWYAPAQPIRGGIPVCFPWFGPHPERGDLPAHGFARLRPFTLVGAQDLPDGSTRLALALRASDDTLALWPHRFELAAAITVGPTLEVTLEVRNTDERPFSFEEALHTYFDVADVRRIGVEGLAGARYLDKADGGAEKRQEGAVTIAAETDRVYPQTAGRCVIADPVAARRLLVDKEGSNTTVVWNPWIAKAARMPDFGDDEWPGMICVETANAAEDRLTLGPGESHRMTVRIGVAK